MREITHGRNVKEHLLIGLNQPRIQRRAIADIVRRHAHQCGIELLVTPRVLRRTVATLYDESGAPIELIGSLVRRTLVRARL